MTQRVELIAEAEGYFAGGTLFAIDWAIGALAALDSARVAPWIQGELRAWLANEHPRLPEWLCAETLSALREIRAP